MPTAALAFSPLGLTVSFTGATTAPDAVRAVTTAPTTRPAYQYRIVNAGAQTVLLGAASTAAAAKDAAASITAGAIPLVPGAVEILSFATATYFSGSTTTGTSVVYITPGEGI